MSDDQVSQAGPQYQTPQYQTTATGTFAPLFRGTLSAEEQIRLEIVKLLAERHGGSPHGLVEAARIVADFVLGRNDAEVIGAVRDLAKRVG